MELRLAVTGIAYPHKDPKHPSTTYRHRPLRTATAHGIDRPNGEPFTAPRATCATSP